MTSSQNWTRDLLICSRLLWPLSCAPLGSMSRELYSSESTATETRTSIHCPSQQKSVRIHETTRHLTQWGVLTCKWRWRLFSLSHQARSLSWLCCHLSNETETECMLRYKWRQHKHHWNALNTTEVAQKKTWQDWIVTSEQLSELTQSTDAKCVKNIEFLWQGGGEGRKKKWKKMKKKKKK